MIKHRFTDDSHVVPALQTFKILWGCKFNSTGAAFSKENVGHLIDKAIAYLVDMSPSKQLNFGGTHSRSTAIKSYLDVPDGDRAEGNLYRQQSESS